MLDLIDFVEIDQADPLLLYAAWAFIGVGAFIFLVGFVGCYGALRGHQCLLGLVRKSNLLFLNVFYNL